MKVYLVNDTSGYHAGCWAVIEAIKQKILSQGHEIIHVTPRPDPPEMWAIHACDAMVVNGEGAMQEEKKGWNCNRARRIMKGLSAAKKLGKKVYLINSVWYNMDPQWSDVLRSLDGLWVREPISQKVMEQDQGVRPEVYLDMSYSCPVDPARGTDKFAGQDVIGTFYKRNMRGQKSFSHRNWCFFRMKRLSLGGAAEKKRSIPDWSWVVNGLSKANVYVTGQHHGVFAAAKARIPFAFFKVYNHKIKGVFDWAGVDIPIATNKKELCDAIDWAKNNRNVFERFYDWMDRLPKWEGIRSLLFLLSIAWAVKFCVL